VSKIVGFFSREYRNFNIDGIFGLQALDGILQDLLSEARRKRIKISSDVLQILIQLHAKAYVAARKAQPYLKASDPDYYRRDGFLARQAWPFKREFRSLDTSFYQSIPQENQKQGPDAKTSNECISDLIGDHRTGASPCNVTDKCWRFVLRKNTMGYMTTHQALYLMILEVKGCLPIIKKRLLTSQMKRKGTVESIFETLCANVYKEVTSKEGVLDRQQRSRDVSEKDLYMEQCYVCGILGYHKFLSLDRLSVILGWQLKPGCYGIDRNTSDDRKEDGNEVEENWSEELINNADHKSYFATNTRSEDLENGKTRKLTSNLPAGCRRHITGVATGLLGVYLKWLLTVPPQMLM